MSIGVLSLQGDVREHVAAVESLGVEACCVHRASDLDGLAGLIIPGGESTTLSMLLESSGLFDPLGEALRHGLPVFGTCAGMILLASSVQDGRPDQRRFEMIDIDVRRNGYGRQVASFEAEVSVEGVHGPAVPAVFIRAPIVVSAGPGVEVLATLTDESNEGGRPVVCRQGSVLVASFHPELTSDRRLHRLFLEMTNEEIG